MNINTSIVPTLVLALVLFRIGDASARRLARPAARILMYAAAAVAALPAVLFTAYYLHIFDAWKAFYDFRSLPLTELSASGAGLLAGLVPGVAGRKGGPGEVLRWASAGTLILWLAVPYLKPVVDPVNFGEFHDEWRDGVCLQSTESSCGPAAAATLMKAGGVSATELELARECYTSYGGTENWYLKRSLKRRGLDASCVIMEAQPGRLPYPSVAGVRLGGAEGQGHFMAVLGEENGRYTIGEPRLGRILSSRKELSDTYYFTGFFLVVADRVVR